MKSNAYLNEIPDEPLALRITEVKTMMMNLKRKLDEANKLIFVKKYEHAAAVLDNALEDAKGKEEMLIHLRRIELGARLNQLPSLRDTYLQWLQSKSISDITGEICMTLVEQQGDFITANEAIGRFKNIIDRVGDFAAAYFGIALAFENQGNIERALHHYRESIRSDPNWYPSYFGLSQLYYSQNLDVEGDNYFFLFEKHAPFNLYGNFETHKNLCQEFLDAEKFEEAKSAITALSEWWIESQGRCPVEIQVFENMTMAKICEAEKNMAEFRMYLTRTEQIIDLSLKDSISDVNVYYFIAKTVEEFDKGDWAVRIYKKILSMGGMNSSLVQKIGAHFLAINDLEAGREVFEYAYEKFPDSQSVRFCLLVLKLSQARIDIEKYLAEKENILDSMLHGQGYRSDIIPRLEALVNMFPQDPDVFCALAERYASTGMAKQAKINFAHMHEFDPAGLTGNLKYANYLLSLGEFDIAGPLTDKIHIDESYPAEQQVDFYWIRANLCEAQGQMSTALEALDRALKLDPWNLNVLLLQAKCLTKGTDLEASLADLEALKVKESPDPDVDWERFRDITLSCHKQHHNALAYVRAKIHYLFQPDLRQLELIVASSATHDAQKGCSELIKLINTNYDSPQIYLSLARLRKELWQLETSSSWLNDALNFANLDAVTKGNICMELADNCVWQNVNIAKAIEYAKLAGELAPQLLRRLRVILCHAYLRNGDIHAATEITANLEQDHDFELTYLRGLIAYRNNQPELAKKLWKPLVSFQGTNLRLYHIKQELLKYYYDGISYAHLKAQ